jgi:N-methylhydantoinase A
MSETALDDRPFRVGVDIGGTFTDLCLADGDGVVAIAKTLSTKDSPADAVERVLVEALADAGTSAGELSLFVHGTTLFTNAIIERKGARTALLTTRGFRDIVEIGRERRYELYDLQVELPVPLVPRHLRFDVPERTLADGTEAEPLDEDYVERLARELEAAGVEAVGVGFLHSYASPEHERRAGAAIERAAPSLRVSLSSAVAPEIREFERISTTLANAYVQGLVESYLEDLVARVERLGFRGRFTVMLSSGGIATQETATRFPVRLLESGPAAGALAAAALGEESGEPDLLSFDMGGTTAKLCLVTGGRPLVTEEFEVDRVYRLKRGSGLPIKTPVIDMVEIGVGGGSIARVSALETVAVGPESAGSDPGPACYALGGTEPTVTDADLVLGYIDPGYFLGGRLRLDLEAARRAIEESVAGPLGLSLDEAAWGIHEIANQDMANAARVHVVERGREPSLLPVYAFGGAGPVHALGVAAALGSRAVCVPRGAGVLSAAGFLVAPLAFDLVRTRRALLAEVDWAEALFAEMEAEGARVLSAAGIEDVSHARSADLRYVGQGHELRVDVPPGGVGALAEEFARLYRELYGHEGPAVPVEALNWRVLSSGPRPELRLSPRESPSGEPRKGEREAYFPGGRRVVPVFDRYALEPGMRVEGPAILEERESTLVVPPNRRAEVTANLAVLVR